MNPDDQGQVPMVIGSEKGLIKMIFPKPITWIAFDPDQAMEVASIIVQHARRCGSKKPLIVTIKEKKS